MKSSVSKIHKDLFMKICHYLIITNIYSQFRQLKSETSPFFIYLKIFCRSYKGEEVSKVTYQ